VKQRWFDINAADREDVLEAAREALEVLARRERRIKEAIREAFDARRAIPWKDVEEVFAEAERDQPLYGRGAVHRAAEVLLDELGLRGWAFLPPRDVRRITAPQAQSTAVKMRPRVKRLLEE